MAEDPDFVVAHRVAETEIQDCRARRSSSCAINAIVQALRQRIFFKDSLLSPAKLQSGKESKAEPRQDLEKATTVRYLAYGSNLSAETFLGRRGIRPISQMNVCVPSLRLTFDLPGLPYLEPCFANTASRDSEESDINFLDEKLTQSELPLDSSEGLPHYRKNDWHKPLVGVLYELTPEDFAHVLATEGGGAAYQDIIVTCYPLEASSTTVPMHPTTKPVDGHTLFAPATPSTPQEASSQQPLQKSLSHVQPTYSNGDDNHRGRAPRPDPSYAQASPRYLKLITDGAAEHNLPVEYREFLATLRPYRPTTLSQQAGKLIFATVWVPLLMLLFSLQPLVQDEKGRNPPWMIKLLDLLFRAMWMSYDGLLHNVFGDGERTIGDDGP